MIKICFVCLGNICRSPMAMFIMQEKLKRLSLENKIVVSSKATSNEEDGNDMHPQAKAILSKKNIPFTKHQAQKLKKEDYEKYDYFIGMDYYNIRCMHNIFENDYQGKIQLLLDREIKDPWYTHNFEEAYQDLEKGVDALIKKLL